MAKRTKKVGITGKYGTRDVATYFTKGVGENIQSSDDVFFGIRKKEKHIHRLIDLHGILLRCDKHVPLVILNLYLLLKLIR